MKRKGDFALNRGHMQRNVMSWKGWLLIFGIILLVGLGTHHILKGQQAQMTQERHEQDATRAHEEGLLLEKKNDLAEVNSPDYIVRVAQENYDLVNREEIHFEFDHPENLRNYTPEELAIWMNEVRH